ncbi:MAG: hypothetical protein A2V88_00315 [Elusimicrobia bacterium RBG_16_66_12]|nr:MAG: hypothetical protein A2V88_00315 [Elusimicrobia bacterium RBG_16_66_12]
MMKNTIPFMLVALLAAQAAPAATLPVELGGIKPLDSRGRKFAPIKYKIEEGPAADPPVDLQNLTKDQLEAAARFLAPDPSDPPKNLSPYLVYRLMDVLAKVDMNYKRPIPQAEWDRRLQEMKDEFVKKNGTPGGEERSAQQWEQSVDEMISGLVDKLDDPHTRYMPREEAKRYAEEMKGSFGGVGASLEKVDEGVRLTVVYPGSPAEKAGLVSGDVVTAVDGAPTKGRDLKDVVGRLRGPEGSPVEIRVTRLDRPVTVTRAAIRTPDLFAKMAAPGVGYVYFSQFRPAVDARLFAKIDELKRMGAVKLIIDLRDNPGGLLAMADSIASEFLQDRDVIVTTKRQGRLATKAVTEGPGRFFGMPLAVLVNNGSASASEILAAALQEHGRAVVVGSQSYGKGSFQLAMPTQVPVIHPSGIVVNSRGDGTLIKVTEGGWYTPQDRSVEGRHDPAAGHNVPGSGGVTPDEAVTVSPEDETKVLVGINDQLFGRGAGAASDPALEKAVEVLNRR